MEVASIALYNLIVIIVANIIEIAIWGFSVFCSVGSSHSDLDMLGLTDYFLNGEITVNYQFSIRVALRWDRFGDEFRI